MPTPEDVLDQYLARGQERAAAGSAEDILDRYLGATAAPAAVPVRRESPWATWGRAAAYPMRKLFVDFPNAVDRAIGSMIAAPSPVPVNPMMLPLSPFNLSQGMTGQGPRAAEAIAGRLGVEPGASLLPQEYALGIDYMTRSPAGSIGRFALSPEGAGLAANIGAGELLNPIGLGVIAPAARAVGRAANPLRQVPGARQVGDFFSRGFSIRQPATREAFREGIEREMGAEALANAQLAEETIAREGMARAIAARTGETPETVQIRVRDAIEAIPRTRGQSFRALQSDERRLAQSLEAQYIREPQERIAAGLDPYELHGHIPVPERQALTGFSPRVATRRYRDVLEEERGEAPSFVTPSGVSTRPGRAREMDPRLTTSQAEQALSAAHPELGAAPAFKPIIEGSLIRGEAAHAQLRNARIADRLLSISTAHGPAADVPKGWKRLSDLTGLQTGFSPARQTALKSAIVPDAEFRAAEDFARAVGRLTQPKNELVRGVRSAIQGFGTAFKIGATSVNPRFIERNIEWNALIGTVRGNRDPRNFAIAGNALSRVEEGAKVPGLPLRYRGLHRELVENRIVGQGFSIEAALARAGSDETTLARILKRGIGGETLKIPGVEDLRAFNQAQEDLFRASFYVAKRRTGLSPTEAAREVRITYFNYGRDAYTSGEGAIRRNAILFYSWMRRILPLTLRSVGETPGAFAQIGNTVSSVSLWNGMHPEEVQYLGPDMLQSLGMALPPYPGQKPSERRILNLGMIGFTDPNALIGTRDRGALGPIENLLAAVNPAIRLPLSLVTRRDYFRGRQLDGSAAELPSYLWPLVQFAPKVAEKLDIRRDEQTGRIIGTDFAREILSGVGPFPAAVADLQAAANGDAAAQQRARAWLTAINESVRDLNVGRDIAAAKARKRVEEERRRERSRSYLFQRFREDEDRARRLQGAAP